MTRQIIIKNKLFNVISAGSKGDCLFKCLAKSLNLRSDMSVRSQIVSHVVANWNDYMYDVLNIFKMNNSNKYASYMKEKHCYGSLLECRAAAEFYKIHIIVVRQTLTKEYYFIRFDNNINLSNKTVYLLFTGQSEESHRDGHFEILSSTTLESVDNNLFKHDLEKRSEISTKNINTIYDNKISGNTSFESLNNSKHDDDDSNSDNDSSENDDDGNDADNDDIDLNTFTSERQNSRSRNLTSNRRTTDIKSDTSIQDILINAAFDIPQHYYTVVEKKLILRVRQFFEIEKRQGFTADINKVIEKTAACLQISTATVHRVTKSWVESQDLEIKSKPGRPEIPLDEYMQGLIRRELHNFYANKEYPTVEALHRRLHECLRENDPNEHITFEITTLRKWLKKLNFKYKKLKKKPILMESYRIRTQRDEYLHDINYYRNNGWNIFYTDETWCGANHSRKYGWVEQITTSENNNFDLYQNSVQEIYGERGGFITPSGAGKRVIILHIGSKDGFVDGCMKCFIGQKNSGDYHDEMNAQHYEEWFREVMMKLPNKSIFVLDQAPYHTMLDPEFRNPTTGWPKQKIINWLIKRKIPVPKNRCAFENLTRLMLLKLARPHHHPKKYLLETIAKEIRGDDVKLLWLPVAHCEYNAIELVWAFVKNYVAKHNKTFKVNEVHKLCEENMMNISSSLWSNCVRHAEDEEEKSRKIDLHISSQLEPLIINVDNDDDSDSNEDFSDSAENNLD